MYLALLTLGVSVSLELLDDFLYGLEESEDYRVKVDSRLPNVPSQHFDSIRRAFIRMR